MSNQNFVVKLKRPRHDTMEGIFVSCSAISYEHDCLNGVILTTHNHGGTGIDSMFRIPNSNSIPKDRAGWINEDVWQSVVVENLSGKSVHVFKVSDEDIEKQFRKNRQGQ